MKYREVWGIFYKGRMKDFAHSKSAAEGIYREDYAGNGEDEHYEVINITPPSKEEVNRRSWEGEVDRQGGSFTQEEMDPMRGWK